MLSRVLTVACGLSLTVAVAGCVYLTPQDSMSNWSDGPIKIVTVKTDTGKGGQITETQPNNEPIFDTTSLPFDNKHALATESRQILALPSDTQTGNTADELPDLPETNVQDKARVSVNPAVDDNPERLMGLGGSELIIILGSPQFLRRDSSSQLWRYRNKSCILDLFLYRNVSPSEFFVNYIEVRGAKGEVALKRECFGELLLQKFAGEAS